MFSALRQGSTVYIVEKTNEGLVYKTAQVSSVSSPQFNGNNYLSNPFNSTINITVNDNGNNRDFGGLPSNENIVRYSNGAVIVSESREAIMTEVDNLVRTRESVLTEENLTYHKNVVASGKDVLAKLNPQFAKEQALDKEVKNLHGRVDAMDGKLDKLIALMSNAGTK